jgi:predicted GNAT family acetyltransferase
VTPRLAAGSLWLWEVDGTPVAMAGHADLVDTPSGAVARIGPVYTPEPLRRQGLGAAVTAAVIEELLPRATTVMLFADAANPTSNRIYARLGFRAAGEVVEVSLD